MNTWINNEIKIGHNSIQYGSTQLCLNPNQGFSYICLKLKQTFLISRSLIQVSFVSEVSYDWPTAELSVIVKCRQDPIIDAMMP